MDKRQIELVKTTWSYVILRREQAGEDFYQKLFELDPSVRQLFKEDITVQSKKLIDTVAFIITKLDCLDTITEQVTALAKRHASYGAKPEHYSLVKISLIHMLKNGLSNRWNTETETAWSAVFDTLAQAMIKAQLEARNSPSMTSR